MIGNSDGLDSKPSFISGNPSLPVEGVSYEDLQVFLLTLNEKEKSANRLPDRWQYDLPTEAHGNMPAGLAPIRSFLLVTQYPV